MRIHDQQTLSLEIDGCGRRSHPVGGLFGKRNTEPEGGAFAVLRLDANPAVHQFHQLFTDGQAQAGAPVLAAGRRVRLGERLKQEAE